MSTAAVPDTALSKKLGLRGPLILAPLGGGPSTPELVAACSNAGALGSLGGAYAQPEALGRDIARTRELTAAPFAVNLFAVPPRAAAIEVDPAELAAALKATRPYREALGLPDPSLKPPFHPDLDRQLAVVLEARPAVLSFVFGLLEPAAVAEGRRRGIFLLGTATSPAEGRALQESGVDAVVAQGFEAGGHRGMFRTTDTDPELSTRELTTKLARELTIPVVASGGIMDGAGIVRALGWGAQAAALGTAFLACDEAGTSRPYREALLARGRATRTTRAFSGRWARGLENRFLREQGGAKVLPFPAQNAFTRDIRNAAVQAGQPEFLSLWAGIGYELIRAVPAARLVETLFREMGDAS